MNTKICALVVMAAGLSLPGCKTTGDTAYVPAAAEHLSDEVRQSASAPPKGGGRGR